MPSRLEKAYDFDESEIALNCAGRLSPRQHELLEEYDRINRLGWRFSLAVIFVCLALFALIPLFAIGIESLRKYPEIVYSYAAVIAVVSVLYFISYIWGTRHRADVKDRRISFVEGTARNHRKKKIRQFTAYFLKIGDVEFQIETAARFKAFEPNAAYTIYYIKYAPTHIVLSARKLEEQQIEQRRIFNRDEGNERDED